MTTIVGVVVDGTAWLGGDSAAVEGDDLMIRRDEKVFPLKGEDGQDLHLLAGVGGSYRAGQLLRWSCPVPLPLLETTPEGWLVNDLIAGFRRVLVAHGAMGQDNGLERVAGHFLLALPGRVVALYDDLAYEEAEEGFLAVGTGAIAALGAMWGYARARGVYRAEEVLRVGLMAATRYTTTTRPPFVYRSTAGHYVRERE